MADPIYHIAPLSELRGGTREGTYTPARFAEDGFVHCSATPRAVLAVARDYFAGVDEPVVLVLIDPDRLRARVVYEAAAPIAGAGATHLGASDSFPHIYGAVDVAAIIGVAYLVKSGNDFFWPDGLVASDDVLGVKR